MTQEEKLKKTEIANGLYEFIVNLLKKEIELKEELELEEMRDDGEVIYCEAGDGSREPSEESQELAFKRACNSIISDGASMHIDFSKIDDVIEKIIRLEILGQ